MALYNNYNILLYFLIFVFILRIFPLQLFENVLLKRENTRVLNSLKYNKNCQRHIYFYSDTNIKIKMMYK